MMPEITVTAPRYEYQDEAWLGMVEGVVVEAQRPFGNRKEHPSTQMSTVIDYGYSVYFLFSFTLVLVVSSVLYMSLGSYFVGKEVKQ
jgi:hypothetical protein